VFCQKRKEKKNVQANGSMLKTDYVKHFFFLLFFGILYRNYKNKNPSDMCIPILYIFLKLNFSALFLCFVFICRRQRRCRRHIRTYVRWYLLGRYVACFRFLPVPSRKVPTHIQPWPEEEKERHRNVQAHSHIYVRAYIQTPALDRFVVVAGYHPVLYGAAPLLR